MEQKVRSQLELDELKRLNQRLNLQNKQLFDKNLENQKVYDNLIAEQKNASSLRTENNLLKQSVKGMSEDLILQKKLMLSA